MNLRLLKLLGICGLWWFIASCGTFEKVRKSSDVNYKLTKANEYFDSKAVHSAISDTPAETPKRKKKG